MNSEPKNCPRCGGDELSWGYSAPPFQGSVECHADGCEAYAVADNERDAIDLWNSGVWHGRPVEWDNHGNPCEFEFNEA